MAVFSMFSFLPLSFSLSLRPSSLPPSLSRSLPILSYALPLHLTNLITFLSTSLSSINPTQANFEKLANPTPCSFSFSSYDAGVHRHDEDVYGTASKTKVNAENAFFRRMCGIFRDFDIPLQLWSSICISLTADMQFDVHVDIVCVLCARDVANKRVHVHVRAPGEYHRRSSLSVAS